MNKIYLLFLIALSGCQIPTGNYDYRDTTKVQIKNQCVEILEDKEQLIVRATTCDGQNFVEGITMGIARVNKENATLRTFRDAIGVYLSDNNRSCSIEDTIEIFDVWLIGVEAYLDCG